MKVGILSSLSLIFVSSHVVATSKVEPPGNVTLHCHNLRNVVEWTYGPSQPGLQFSISIGSIQGTPEDLLVYPPANRADISHLTDRDDDYFVSVMAVVGQNESDPAPPDGITFSYFMDSQVQQKCVLDFPSVNVTSKQEDKVLVRFDHPWLVYHQKLPVKSKTSSQKKRSHDAQMNELPELKYDIVINKRGQPERFFCDENVCEKTLSVDPAEEMTCLSVTGEMSKISIQGTREYCTTHPKVTPHKQKGVIYIIIGVAVPLALVMIGSLFYMVYKKNTTPSSSFPNAMTFNSKVRQTLRLDREPVSVPEIGPLSPTPLLLDKEEDEEKKITLTENFSSEPDVQGSSGLQAEDEGVCDDAEGDTDEGTGYKQGRNLEDEDDSSSLALTGYEKRPVVVNFGTGDDAEGYRG